MNPLLLLAMFGRVPQLQTVTFNSNTTWVCPAGVSLLSSLAGHGQNGTNDSVGTSSAFVMIVTYHASGSGSDPFAQDWDGLGGPVDTARDTIDEGGPFTVDTGNVHAYANGTSSLTVGSASGTSIAGTAVRVNGGSWHDSGPITNSALSWVSYSANVPGVAGSNAAGFGKTFAGGAANTAASTTTHTNEPVTPGNSYPIVVPSGATIQITYYQ